MCDARGETAAGGGTSGVQQLTEEVVVQRRREELEREGGDTLRGTEGRAEGQLLPRRHLVSHLSEPAHVPGAQAELCRHGRLVVPDEVDDGRLPCGSTCGHTHGAEGRADVDGC